MLKKLRGLVRTAVHRYSAVGKLAEIADNRRHKFNDEVAKARKREARAEEGWELVMSGKPTHSQAEDAEQVLFVAREHLRRMIRKREFWRNRYTEMSARHHHWGLVLKHRRDRVRRWVARHEGFQPYMANGNPYEKLTDEAKHAIYLAFKEGLYVTSTYEGFAGDGVHATTSYHYLTNQPDGRGRCWDAGSSRRGPMAKTQIRQGREFGPYLTEQFGPENSFAYKNGVQFTLAEGTSLEEMHDNHVHTDIRDGAFG
jgi:hypothetical protein